MRRNQPDKQGQHQRFTCSTTGWWSWQPDFKQHRRRLTPAATPPRASLLSSARFSVASWFRTENSLSGSSAICLIRARRCTRYYTARAKPRKHSVHHHTSRPNFPSAVFTHHIREVALANVAARFHLHAAIRSSSDSFEFILINCVTTSTTASSLK